MNGAERILAMWAGQPTDCLPLMPITMMFAADRIGVPYGRYAEDHEVLVEAQIRTAEEFDLDHVSCISDPAREAADCGAIIEFFDDQPPAVNEARAVLADKAVLADLKVPDPFAGRRMYDRIMAAEMFRNRVGGLKLIEGWIEGPCAEAADLRGINRLMTDFYDDPGFVRDLFEFGVAMGLRFAAAQVDAGADFIGVGDAAASLVGPRIYEEFVWPYEKMLIDGLHGMGTRVRLHICGNTRRILGGMGRLQCELTDLDYPVPMEEARREMGLQRVLGGNLHPVRDMRDGTPETIAAALDACRFHAGSRFIVEAGCEIPRGTPAANMHALREYARNHTPTGAAGRGGP
jgi:MtaA/CmuA family methyltransferase